MHKIGDSSESSERIMWNIFSFYILIEKCRLKKCAQSLFQESLDLFAASTCTFQWKSFAGSWEKSWKFERDSDENPPEMKRDEGNEEKGARRSSSNWYIKMSEFHIRRICSDFFFIPCCFTWKFNSRARVETSHALKFDGALKYEWHVKIRPWFNFYLSKSSKLPTVSVLLTT